LFNGGSGHESNGTKLTGSYSPVEIPILGPIVAGYPIEVVPADRETAEEWIELNSGLFRQTDDLYALRVQGDSMIDASVLDGDIVILRHQQEAQNGEMVAAWIDGDNETTLKYFHLKGNTVELTPANPAFEVITRPAAQVRVVGKVVSVIRTLE
jgi:repressor LexA